MKRLTKRTAAVATAMTVAATVIVAVGVGWLVGPGVDRPELPSAAPTPARSQHVERETSLSPSPIAPAPSCGEVARAFDPRTISVPGVVRRATVVTPPRDANGVPGVPPLDSGGKSVFAFDLDQGIRPGDPKGNVLLNAHTWPDGSALGNALLERLRKGDQIVLQGSNGARLCYEVTREVEVLASEGYPPYYRTDGPPQVAIGVCSGARSGAGEWSHRTIWFARPVRI